MGEAQVFEVWNRVRGQEGGPVPQLRRALGFEAHLLACETPRILDVSLVWQAETRR
jgi:hypothetical protein